MSSSARPRAMAILFGLLLLETKEAGLGIGLTDPLPPELLPPALPGPPESELTLAFFILSLRSLSNLSVNPTFSFSMAFNICSRFASDLGLPDDFLDVG